MQPAGGRVLRQHEVVRDLDHGLGVMIQQHSRHSVVVVIVRDDGDQQRGLVSVVQGVHRRAGLQQHVDDRSSVRDVGAGRVVQRVVASTVGFVQQLGLRLEQLPDSFLVPLSDGVVETRPSVFVACGSVHVRRG